MSDSEKHMRTIEVEGVKLEVDMRRAKKIEAYKVGDPVRVLCKNYSGYKVHSGVIVAIEAFEKLPTVVIAYISDILSYSGDGGNVEFVYLNAQTKDTEICPMVDDDIVPTRDTMVTYFNRAIEKKEEEIRAIRSKKKYFLDRYGIAFGVGGKEVEEALGRKEE
jgi:hypothetical protein